MNKKIIIQTFITWFQCTNILSKQNQRRIVRFSSNLYHIHLGWVWAAWSQPLKSIFIFLFLSLFLHICRYIHIYSTDQRQKMEAGGARKGELRSVTHATIKRKCNLFCERCDARRVGKQREEKNTLWFTIQKEFIPGEIKELYFFCVRFSPLVQRPKTHLCRAG